MPKPPAEYVDADGHVDFTGSWKCKSADGDLDGVFADMGIGRAALDLVQHMRIAFLPYNGWILTFLNTDDASARLCCSENHGILWLG